MSDNLTQQDLERLQAEIRHANNELPEEKLTLRDGTTRYRSEKWLHWEIKFMNECFKKTPYPSSSLRKSWAIKLTEKKLRTLKYTGSKDNYAKVWFEYYDRRVRNWVTGERKKLRRAAKAQGLSPYGDLADLQKKMAERGTIDNQNRSQVGFDLFDETISQAEANKPKYIPGQSNHDGVCRFHSERLVDLASPGKREEVYAHNSRCQAAPESESRYDPDVIPGPQAGRVRKGRWTLLSSATNL